MQLECNVKLANVHGQGMFLTEDRQGCGVKMCKQMAGKGVRGTRGGCSMVSLKRDESRKVSQRSLPAGSSELPFFKTVTVGTGPHRPQ